MNHSGAPLDPVLIGKRIRELRRRQHLTQAALAARVGIRTGPMNTIENGHHLPSLPVLHRVSGVFGVDVDRLLSPVALPYMIREHDAQHGYSVVRSEDVFIAEAASYAADRALLIRFDPPECPLDESACDCIEKVAHAFLALEDISKVQKEAGIPLDLKLPVRESGLARYVGNVRNLLGVSDAVIFDYLELFENAGLRIVFLPLPAGVESISCYDRVNRNVFFFIANELNVERQLFRLCYELGRIYLYNGGLRGKRKLGRLDAEHAARRFSALFLMPEEAVACSVCQVGVDRGEWTWELLMRLKHRFGVSAEAFLYRLDELGLIARPLRDRLKNEIYAFYKAHAYAEPDSTRRILTPNGRLGDLLLAASLRNSRELPELRKALDKAKVKA